MSTIFFCSPEHPNGQWEYVASYCKGIRDV
jgi:hypothetical protein